MNIRFFFDLPRSAQLKAEEARKSYVLFAITFFIIVCNSVRFILGLHECISVRQYQAGVENHCIASPLWVLILQSVSNLLLPLNSSLCSILYCLTSRDFQNELRTHYEWIKEQVSPSGEHPPGGPGVPGNSLIQLSMFEDGEFVCVSSCCLEDDDGDELQQHQQREQRQCDAVGVV